MDLNVFIEYMFFNDSLYKKEMWIYIVLIFKIKNMIWYNFDDLKGIFLNIYKEMLYLFFWILKDY